MFSGGLVVLVDVTLVRVDRDGELATGEREVLTGGGDGRVVGVVVDAVPTGAGLELVGLEDGTGVGLGSG